MGKGKVCKTLLLKLSAFLQKKKKKKKQLKQLLNSWVARQRLRAIWEQDWVACRWCWDSRMVGGQALLSFRPWLSPPGPPLRPPPGPEGDPWVWELSQCCSMAQLEWSEWNQILNLLPESRIFFFSAFNLATPHVSGILVSWPRINPVPPTWSLNHWTAREIPRKWDLILPFHLGSSTETSAEWVRVPQMPQQMGSPAPVGTELVPIGRGTVACVCVWSGQGATVCVFCRDAPSWVSASVPLPCSLLVLGRGEPELPLPLQRPSPGSLSESISECRWQHRPPCTPTRVQTAVGCALASVLQHYRVLGWLQSKVLFTLLTSMRTYYPLSFSAAWNEHQSSGNTATVHTFQNSTQGLTRESPCFTRLPFRSPGLLENKLFLF